MALTYSYAGFKSALDDASTAVAAKDWDTAKAKLFDAQLIRQALPSEITVAGVALKLDESLEAARAALASAQTSQGNNKRFIRTGLSRG